MKIVFFSLALVAFFSQTLALKVLGVFPVISSSHFAIGSSIIKSLNNAHHEVTVVSPYPLKKPIKNYRDIDTSDLLAEFKKSELITVFIFGSFSIEISQRTHRNCSSFNSNQLSFIISCQSWERNSLIPT